MLVAQITDTHTTTPGKLLMRVVDTASALERAVSALNSLDPLPDLTVLTGDLVESGEVEEYDHLRTLLAPLCMPVLTILGNHDARESMREAFVAEGYLPRQRFLNYVIEDHALRIIAVDTLVPGEPGGALCEERLLWIDRMLAAAADRPTLLLMHHPPFVTGVGGWTNTASEAAPRLLRSSFDIRRSSGFFVGICIVRSIAVSPGPLPGRPRAQPISSCSISARGTAEVCF